LQFAQLIRRRLVLEDLAAQLGEPVRPLLGLLCPLLGLLCPLPLLVGAQFGPPGALLGLKPFGLQFLKR
jgi:hypothetical protein